MLQWSKWSGQTDTEQTILFLLAYTHKVYTNNDTGTIFMHHGSHSELYFAFRNLIQLCIRLLHLFYSLSCLQFFLTYIILYPISNLSVCSHNSPVGFATFLQITSFVMAILFCKKKFSQKGSE